MTKTASIWDKLCLWVSCFVLHGICELSYNWRHGGAYLTKRFWTVHQQEELLEATQTPFSRTDGYDPKCIFSSHVGFGWWIELYSVSNTFPFSHLKRGVMYHTIFFLLATQPEYRLWRKNMMWWNAHRIVGLYCTLTYIDNLTADERSFTVEGHKHKRAHKYQI